MLFWLLVAVAVAAGGGSAVVLDKARPGLKANKRLGKLKVAKLQPDGDPGVYVGPTVVIGYATGWQPVFIQAAHARMLEWGACFYQWQEDLGKYYAKDSNWAVKHIVKRLGQVMGWVIDASILGWIVRRVCFRVWVPSSAIKIDGEWYFVPSSPRDDYLPTMRPSNTGAMAVPGWNPETTRFGIALEWPEWPLEWPPPKGTVAAAWMRNMGDITGTGFDTWQLVTNQDGSERSFPMMSEDGWRVVFGFARQYGWPGAPDSDPLSMFDVWRLPGYEAMHKSSATKKKADNRYRVPR